MTFETTTLFLPQDFSSQDLEFKDKSGALVGEKIDKNTQKNDDTMINENPYWFDFDGASIVRDGQQQHSLYSENAHHHHQHHHHHHEHNTRRAKRNHNRKLKAASHHDGNVVVAKRSIDYQDDESFVTEVYSASEVIGNIFNENDTIRDPLKANGKYDGMAVT